MTGRIVSIVLLVLLLAACGGGPPGSAGPDGGTGASVPAVGRPSFAPGTSVGGGGGSGGRPSGATVRILNAYAPVNGEPGPIDVFAKPFALAGDPPLLSVPYGALSAAFDPTVADDQGDMFLSMYRAGETGNGNALMSKTETLKGGEAITYFLTTGQNVQESGARFGSLQVLFDRPATGEALLSTPSPGKAHLIVTTSGIENVLSSPGDQSWYLGLSGGDGCTKSVNDAPDTLTGLGPGSGSTYELEPGAYTAAIYSYPRDSSSFPDCAGAPLIAGIPVTLGPDGRVAVYVYAPKDGDYRTLVVPLAK